MVSKLINLKKIKKVCNEIQISESNKCKRKEVIGSLNNKLDIEKLYKTYYMKIYSYIMTIIKDVVEAEELTQETFYKAIKSSYRGDASEFTWLCAIAKNVCYDYLKKSNKLENLDSDISSENTIESMIVNKESTLRIHMVLHELSEPYKEVFSLRIFGELSFKEIGQIFNKSENWARVTYHRARLKIQDKL